MLWKCCSGKVQISSQFSIWRKVHLSSFLLLSPRNLLRWISTNYKIALFFFLLISQYITGLLLRKPWKFVCSSPAMILASSLRVELNCFAIGNGCKLKSSLCSHHSSETKDALGNCFTPSISLILCKGLRCINGHMNSVFILLLRKQSW